MTPIAWLLVLAVSTSVNLVDEVYQIPAGEWRYVEVSLQQRPALVSAAYDVRVGSDQVRLVLMRREDLDRLRDDLPHGFLTMTPPGAAGHFAYQVRQPDDYVVLVDNRAAPSRSATVHLRITLDFAAQSVPQEYSLPAERRLTIVLISLAVFAGIATYSARRLLRAMKGPGD